jgi:predicted small lipoprotein YifL
MILRSFTLCALVAALAGCGADGAPTPPVKASVSGQIKIGVSGSS